MTPETKTTLNHEETTVIDLDQVTKRFGTVVALDDVTLTVESGEVYGFLGPNGAGKTTVINLLLDLISPTSGTVRVLGHDVRARSRRIRERIGVLPELSDVYDRLTGREHVEFAIESKRADDDPDEILERVGIADEGARYAGEYSKGVAQRLLLGMALVGAPDLLILDEPSTGLDPAGAQRMREIVRTENERGATVFFSSHILGQVEEVCDRVGILRDGALVAEDTIQGLREDTIDTALTVELKEVTDDILNAVRRHPAVTDVAVDGTELRVACEDAAETDVLDAIESAGGSLKEFTTETGSLEDPFLDYTTADSEEVQS